MSKFVERDFRSAKFFCRFLKQLRNIVGIVRSPIFPCKNIVIYIFVIPLKKVLFRSCSNWIFKRHFSAVSKRFRTLLLECVFVVSDAEIVFTRTTVWLIVTVFFSKSIADHFKPKISERLKP